MSPGRQMETSKADTIKYFIATIIALVGACSALLRFLL